MDEVKLALELNRVVHNECKDVPHDIGLRLLEVVKKHVGEQLNIPCVIKSACDHNWKEWEDENCNAQMRCTKCKTVKQTVSNHALWRIEPYFDGISTEVTTYKVVDQNGTLQYMGDRNQCQYFLQHGCSK